MSLTDVTSTTLQQQAVDNVTDVLLLNNSTPETEEVNLVWRTGIGLLLGIVVFLTTAGNLLVLLTVVVNSHLRSTTHYFIANLAMADLLVGTTVLPFSASLEVLDYWAFGQVRLRSFLGL